RDSEIRSIVCRIVQQCEGSESDKPASEAADRIRCHVEEARVTDWRKELHRFHAGAHAERYDGDTKQRGARAAESARRYPDRAQPGEEEDVAHRVDGVAQARREVHRTNEPRRDVRPGGISVEIA